MVNPKNWVLLPRIHKNYGISPFSMGKSTINGNFHHRNSAGLGVLHAPAGGALRGPAGDQVGETQEDRSGATGPALGVTGPWENRGENHGKSMGNYGKS